MIESPQPPGGLVGPTGEPLSQPEPAKPQAVKHPLITVAMEQYPAGFFAVVQIRELGADGQINLVKTEVLMPTLREALRKIKALIIDRVNKTQAKNGKGHLHIVPK